MSRRRSLLDLVEHFWLRVDRDGDCWLWTGEVNNMGYGFYMVYEGDSREKLLAHRFSALLAGMPVRSRADVVMHKCDTPRCVRPEHLSVGTQLDNMRDAQRKGRTNLIGLSARMAKCCRDCGESFMARPGQYYCEDHNPHRKQSDAGVSEMSSVRPLLDPQRGQTGVRSDH